MSIYTILAIVFLILLIVVVIRSAKHDNKRFTIELYTIGIVLCATCYGAFVTAACYEKEPTAIDVYRGKTSLEITYRDSVAIDSTVVYKVK